MTQPSNQRRSERVAVQHRTRIWVNGRLVATAMAVNLSLGGMLLSAAPHLPVGSACEVELPAASGLLPVAGRIVRMDTRGLAIQFHQDLSQDAFSEVLTRSAASAGWVASYVRYFQAGQAGDDARCRSLVGVDLRTYQRVVMTTFGLCSLLALLAVWWFRGTIFLLPNPAKVLWACSITAGWLGLVQPTIDLAIFRRLARKG